MDKKIIITIGRQYGAGGRTIAKIIGSKLGIPVYDNDLLTAAAQQFGFSPSIFKKRDEKHHLFSLSKLFSSTTYNADNYMGDAMLFNMQCQVIRDIAQKGSCIIVGRCADYVLRDEKCLTSVFLSAPYEERTRRVMERLDVDQATAHKIIDKKDRNRKDFYNGYTLGHWGEAATYHLCLDSSILGIEGSADLIIEFAKKKAGNR